MPPLQMRRRVAKAVNQAKQFSQDIDLESDLTFIETGKD